MKMFRLGLKSKINEGLMQGLKNKINDTLKPEEKSVLHRKMKELHQKLSDTENENHAMRLLLTKFDGSEKVTEK